MAHWNHVRCHLWILVLVLIGLLGEAASPLLASDALPGPVAGQSATVTQPHVAAELIPESTLVSAGKETAVILHLHMDPNWHTYWINPGDAGLATEIKWTLPPGWTAGPIQWPAPELHAMGPLTTYGYGGDVYLLTTLKAPTETTGHATDVPIKAHATWLVCQEECIPGKADLTVQIHLARPGAKPGDRMVDNHALFAAARARLPVANTAWAVSGLYRSEGVVLTFQPQPGVTPRPMGSLTFFPEQANVLATGHPELKPVSPVTKDPAKVSSVYTTGLAQNGEKPDHLSGVLVSDQPLVGNAKAIYLASFSVSSASPPPLGKTSPASSLPPAGAASVDVGTTSAPAPATSGAASIPALTAPNLQPFLLAVLGAAFLGGLILNLMPCVLPVLSLKVFSLVRHAGDNGGGAWKQGLAFTVGVVLSFWILAGLLLALRAAGNHLGWGFQMQSPGFVLALIFLFFLLGLNLLGVFELGSSLVGLDAKTSSHFGGLASSFANGALATLAATPCTAPFMGSSVGFAAQEPPALALLIFTFLALGMAAPYLLLTAFPGALRLVPKPGPWMEALRQVMGFLLLGTVIFLVYVFGALVGEEQLPWLLAALLLAGVAAWIFGRWSPPVHTFPVRALAMLLAVAFLAVAISWGVNLAHATPPSATTGSSPDGWTTYSPTAVQRALKQNQPAFVDFTAAWCLSCKVNERVALDVDSTRRAFADKHVALFRGDWTHSDPQISKTLQEYHRDGVPLYLLYSPKDPTAPEVLPEVLTPGIVQSALQKLP